MKLLLATNHLGFGGSESYLLTIAEQLDRLAHEVLLYVPEMGNGVAAARERGLSVVAGLEEAERFDAAIVQDAGVSHQVADALPETPQVFVAHSETYDLQAPPQLAGLVGAAVALNDRVAARLRRFATEIEVVRLRQPIDIDRFASAGPLPERPRRVLLLSNNPNRDRLRMLRGACAEAGMELATLGGRGQSSDPRRNLAGAEIVIGYGRSILEAMSSGRAAYVYDWYGGDGWVTVESYPRIEADGIAGRDRSTTIDAERLAADLRRYERSMGPANRDLVVTHHRANIHAQQLLELVGRIAEPEPPRRGPLEEMARLVRLEWRARDDVRSLQRENLELRETQRRMQDATDEVMLRLRESEEERHRLLTSTSWRLTRPLRSLLKRRRR